MEVTLTWVCDGAPPGAVTSGGGGKSKKGGALTYDAATGVIVIGSGGGKLGSQQDFSYDGVSEGIHVSCSAPFGIGVRSIGPGQSKKCQGGCEGTPCTGCFEVTAATSSGGGQYCEVNCADF